MRVIAGLVAAATAFAAAGAGAGAQTNFPTKPVKIVVPLAAGGSSDIAARALAEGLSERWKQPVVVENRPGGGTTIAMQYVAAAPADGYILAAFATTHSINPAVRASLPYDTFKNFVYISMFMDAPMSIVAHSSFAANTLPELIAEAKKQGNPILFASPGVASAGHMGGALLQSRAGVKLKHIAYTGNATALPDVLSGRVPLFVTPVSGTSQNIDNGNLKFIAVLGPNRLSDYPKVPTASETIPGFVVRAFTGIAAPAGTPADVVKKIADDVQAVVASQKYVAIGAKSGFVPWSTTPEETEKVMKSEVEQWKEIAKAEDIKVD